MSQQDKKLAVVLFNLGGPNHKTSVKEFLFNLFYDKAILTFPNPFRWILAKMLSSLRAKSSQANYDLIGGYSPILENTIKQAKALEDKFINAKVFICMRYSFPRVMDIIKDLKKFQPEEIILLPLYPQFSSTTSNSSIQDFKKTVFKSFPNIPIKSVCCFYREEKYIGSQVQLIEDALKSIDKNHIILFSAHGLPKKIIDNGDPYQSHIEETVARILDKLSFKPTEYIISYQSRVGPIEWIKPYTEDEIIKAAKLNKTIIIIPIAFVSEHLETLVELDIEYKEIAYKNGAKDYIRVSTSSDNDLFIESLVDIVNRFKGQGLINIQSCELKRICAEKFKQCINQG